MSVRSHPSSPRPTRSLRVYLVTHLAADCHSCSVSPQNPRAPKHRPAMWINAQFRSGDICRAPPSAKRRKYMYPRLVVHLPRIPCSTGSRGVRPLCCFLPLRPGCLGPLSPLPHAPRPLEFVSPLSPRTELRSPPQPSVVRSKTSPRPVLRTQPVKTKG